ncbi:MAG: family 43 glycosylhydrolase [Clostridia bacterium]|nr:family 43 glycosylhydrolase [Clostridia bacterium]
MIMQAFNPYLPSWEYTPDGEPHVFEGRVYVYGSHDRFRGQTYCLNDYVCWSAPEENLADWRYEGVIFKKTDDPDNPDGEGCLFAPDVTRGPDGRYYLYYVLSNKGYVSVAVCDKPAGKYEYLGNVRWPDGVRLGEREGDEPQFDPGVLTEGDLTYMYTGFCGPWDESRTGPMMTVLGPDMLTVVNGPVTIMPSAPYAKGTQWAGHEFFEASSIRKFDGRYYFVYSSVVMHELCYATAPRPEGPFTYGGVAVSNCDMHIDSYKPANKPMYYGANNHGGLVEVKGKRYIFYHRHTDGTNYSRQGMAEPVEIAPDGRIAQAEMTSCGLNGGPLKGEGYYPAYIACNLFTDKESVYTGGSGGNGFWMDGCFPKITQDGRDGDEEPGYIANMTESATCGFKYFDCRGVKRVGIRVRGYAGGRFEVKTQWDGPVLGSIPVRFTNLWTDYAADIAIPDGVQAIYLTYRGPGSAQLAGVEMGK